MGKKSRCFFMRAKTQDLCGVHNCTFFACTLCDGHPSFLVSIQRPKGVLDSTWRVFHCTFCHLVFDKSEMTCCSFRKDMKRQTSTGANKKIKKNAKTLVFRDPRFIHLPYVQCTSVHCISTGQAFPLRNAAILHCCDLFSSRDVRVAFQSAIG